MVVVVVDSDQWAHQEVGLVESQSAELPSPGALCAEPRLEFQTQSLTMALAAAIGEAVAASVAQAVPLASVAWLAGQVQALLKEAAR